MRTVRFVIKLYQFDMRVASFDRRQPDVLLPLFVTQLARFATE